MFVEHNTTHSLVSMCVCVCVYMYVVSVGQVLVKRSDLLREELYIGHSRGLQIFLPDFFFLSSHKKKKKFESSLGPDEKPGPKKRPGSADEVLTQSLVFLYLCGLF